MNYYIRKAAGLLVTLLLVSFITFSVFQILPGNPAYIILGVDADPMQIEALNKSMGLDNPALAAALLFGTYSYSTRIFLQSHSLYYFLHIVPAHCLV